MRSNRSRSWHSELVRLPPPALHRSGIHTQAERITLARMGQREIATSVTELGAAACGDQGVGVVAAG